ncbi:Ig-like domain-containing protein [Colwellia psychrerythraea]|uniref:WD40-like beta Propeller containing protein n=1 Tax=Colwellia psychrerythraea TaxID=28229 RepID=A0A099L1D4_COLPS|nr:Ig-like domain-containing protein [Colwellia psychrerythraea]KGJ96794.1 WD40-like beta Propeller containing protein [Colwellia psychrerythraea]
MIKAKFINSIILVFVFFLQAKAFAQDPIVYSRCARTTATFDLQADVTINGQVQQASRLMKGLDIYDVLPDVTNFFGDFSAPCDLMFRDDQGNERVLYDCSSTSTDANSCAALDPAVSFDGKTIAFSVFRGTLKNHALYIRHDIIDENADPTYTDKLDLPNKRLETTGAHLHTVDVATGALSIQPYEEGIYDSGPAFLANGRLAFTSNRDKHSTTVVWRSTGSKVGTRIWSVDLNWKNLDLSSHHSLSQEQHPYLLKNGRLAYSSWQILGAQPFRYTNGSIGGFNTLDNMFNIYSQFPDGAENFALFGQHSGSHYPSYFGEDHNAAHFLTQTSDERIWFADYYRGNNNGLGALIGFLAESNGQEGMAPSESQDHADLFVPRDVINFASWAINGDQVSTTLSSPSIKHPNYTSDLIFSGKAGHPAALSNNGLMLSWGKGPCSTLASGQIFKDLGRTVPPLVDGSGSGVAMNMMTHLNLDTPACDVGIYRATTIPSLHPGDLELIVDSPNWHEIMAKAVVPYITIHGVEKPENIASSADKLAHPLLEKGTPFGLLGAASITDRETHPQEGIKFVGEKQFNLQGTDTVNYNDEDLCGVRILSVMPNRDRNTFYGLSNLFGERVGILGEFSVLNKDDAGNVINDISGHADTSFLVRFPANSPYLMQGIDCKGRTLNTDMTWQSLRPGEKKTCGGCHVHSKPSRITFEDSHAATPGYTVPRLGEGIIPLLNGKVNDNGKETVTIKEVPGYAMSIDFTRDIMPIFQQRCTSCHGGDSPEADLALDIAGDNKRNKIPNATWWCLVGDYKQECLSAANQFNTGEGSNNTAFRRPQVSKYIRAFNSLGSLLYWKAANERTDRNTDASYADDIDFGVDHPTTITADELGMLSRWIDIGVPGGDDELLDTQKPTLHMVPASTDETVSKVKIGTVDIGSGINPASLVVCVLDSQDNCTNIAANAEMSGVIILDLNQTLTDPTIEILASVEDVTGNKTEIRRTVGFLTSGKNSNITITPINDADLVEKETYSFSVDVTDGNAVSNTITVVASQGTVKLVSGDEYTLIPPANYNGDIFVMVIVVDDENSSDADSSSFTVSVTQLNDAPTSVTATISTTTNTVSSAVNAEIVDPDFNDTHTITIKVEPTNGSVIIDGTALVYKPNNGFHGTDSFEVTVTDSGDLSVDGTISVIVNQFNTAPISVSATIETTMNTASAEVYVDIVDPDLNDTHIITINTEPVNGSVLINGTAVIYTPNSDFHGTDSFDITVTDSGGLSIDGIISVMVNELNTAPKFEAPLIGTTMNTASVEVNIEVVDPDPNDTHTIIIKTEPANGSVAINGIALVYTPNSDFHGADSFEITVTDSHGLNVSGTINVVVNELNTAPKSVTALIETVMNTVSEKVTVDIVDVDSGDTHVLTFKTEPYYGTAVIDGITLTYTPKVDFFGGETFAITVTDSGGLSVDGKVNVTVAATDTGGGDTGGGDTGGGDTGGGDTGGGDTGGGDTGGGDTGGGDTGGGDTGGGDTGGGDTGGGDTVNNITPEEKDEGGSFNFYILLLLLSVWVNKALKYRR